VFSNQTNNSGINKRATAMIAIRTSPNVITPIIRPIEAFFLLFLSSAGILLLAINPVTTAARESHSPEK